MATRFNPAGYKPELSGLPTAAKVRTAVDGLDDLMDDYEFHYPQELSRDNLEEVQQALDGHGIYCLASGLHLDPRFAKGGFSSPDDATRAAARGLTIEGIDLAGELGAHFIIWPGIEGYNYPFQTPYASSCQRFVDGVGEAAQHARDRGVAPGTASTANGSASTSTPTPRTPSARSSGPCSSGASSTASPRRSTSPLCARHSRTRTPSEPTSSSTPRSAPDAPGTKRYRFG